LISIKDIGTILGILGMAIPGGIYVHDTKMEVAELGRDYRQHVVDSQLYDTQKSIWQYQDRLKSNPSDNSASERLRQLEYDQKLLEYKRNQLKKETN